LVLSEWQGKGRYGGGESFRPMGGGESTGGGELKVFKRKWLRELA